MKSNIIIILFNLLIDKIQMMDCIWINCPHDNYGKGLKVLMHHSNPTYIGAINSFRAKSLISLDKKRCINRVRLSSRSFSVNER